MAIHFNENDVRCTGRSSSGVRGISLNEGDKVVGAAVITEEADEVLVVTAKGYGKRSHIDEYRLQSRGGSGVKALNITEKNGSLVALKSVSANNDLLITTDRGVVIRMHVSDISQTGRATQGVILFKVKENQNIATVAVVDKEDDTTSLNEENEKQENVDNQTVIDNQESQTQTE